MRVIIGGALRKADYLVMASPETWYVLEDRRKVKKLIGKLLSRKTVLSISLKSDKTNYTSRVIKINHEESSSPAGASTGIIIEKVKPDIGNALIQSFPDVTLEFPYKSSECRCIVKYAGISNEYPYYGIILDFPKSVEIAEQRREERHVYEMPEMVSVEFRLDKGPDKVYSLNVYDASRHGLGILITEKDYDLLEILEQGDEIKDITFYATSAMIKVDGTVRHKSLIKEGKYRNCYILGIESPDIIDDFKTKKR